MWVYVYVHVYIYVYVYGTLRHGVLHCTTSHPSGVVLASVSPTGSSSQAAAHAVRDMRHTSTCDYTNYSITAPRRWGRCGRRCTARSRWPASTASRGAKRITSSSPASAPTSIRYAVVFSRILFVFSRILSYSFVSPGLFTVDSSRAAPPTTRHVAAPAAKHLVRAAASCLHQHAAAAILCPCLPSAMNLFTPAKPEHVMPVVLALRHRQPNWGAVSPPTQPGWVPATVCPRPVPIVFGRTKLPPNKAILKFSPVVPESLVQFAQGTDCLSDPQRPHQRPRSGVSRVPGRSHPVGSDIIPSPQFPLELHRRASASCRTRAG